MTIKTRLARLEAATQIGREVTLEEVVQWSRNRPPHPDPETARKYEDYLRRCKNSELCRLIAATASKRREV
ncbi:MAG: hypothetical protein HQL37_16470 [Alphaproteobacteria bacterium]|nr:hypothetical protein [Alphaproteobacteria bacterium]